MKSYLVLLSNVATKELVSTVCKNNDEVATLIAHLDTSKYSVEKIEAITGFIQDMDHFCIKNDNLETGKKEEGKQ